MTTLFHRKLGQGPPVLILPGLLGSTDHWQKIAQQLALHHTLYLVDHRNHSQSFHSDVMTYEAMAADLQELITQQGIIDPVLIGHSMGGKVVMQFAQTYPKVPHKLIVADIAPKAYDMTRLAKILQTLKGTPLHRMRTRTEVDQYLHHDIPEASVRLYCMKNIHRNKQGKLVWRSNIPVLADHIPDLEKAVTLRVPFYKPTLFIKAEQSDYIQPQDLVLIKAMFPKYVLKRIKNAGHWVGYHQPAAVLKVIEQFLQA
jgi:esterase